MPELPEVETIRRGLHPVLMNATIIKLKTHRPNLRYPFPKNLDAISRSATIRQVKRLSKYILIRLSTGYSLISHLGMTGTYTIRSTQTKPSPQKHDHFTLYLDNGHTITYNDPRRFGFLLSVETDKEGKISHLQNLGVEPMSASLTPQYLRAIFKHRCAPIKNTLLEQSAIAGLGNIYVCESLWRAKINPRAQTKDISEQRLALLIKKIKDVIDEAIKMGGSSLQNYRSTQGNTGYFQHNFDVYGRVGQDCHGCQEKIQRIVQSGRSTFYCPNCQKSI